VLGGGFCVAAAVGENALVMKENADDSSSLPLLKAASKCGRRKLGPHSKKGAFGVVGVRGDNNPLYPPNGAPGSRLGESGTFGQKDVGEVRPPGDSIPPKFELVGMAIVKANPGFVGLGAIGTFGWSNPDPEGELEL